MKRAILPLIVSLAVLAGCIMWFFKSEWKLGLTDIFQFSLIVMLVGFAIWVAYSRIMSHRRGQPSDDELSRKLLQKAAATSFYVSIYLWLVIMYITSEKKADPEPMFGWGILGMAAMFFLSWVFYRFKGIKDA